MTDSPKQRVMNAIHKYSKKQMPKKKRGNAKPEKEVVYACMNWLIDNGFSCHIVESKAVYSRSAGIYLSGQTDPGMSDIVGCTFNGYGAFIEVKAKGKKSTLKDHQREFLLSKIERGAFAVCVDSADDLEHQWLAFIDREPLENLLPKKKKTASKKNDSGEFAF